jgi:hypothetical protein
MAEKRVPNASSMLFMTGATWPKKKMNCCCLGAAAVLLLLVRLSRSRTGALI